MKYRFKKNCFLVDPLKYLENLFQGKTTYSRLKISEMAFSILSELPAFFRPRQFNFFKLPNNSGLQNGIVPPQKITLEGLLCSILLWCSRQVKLKIRNDSGLYDRAEFAPWCAVSGKSMLNFTRGFDKTSIFSPPLMPSLRVLLNRIRWLAGSKKNRLKSLWLDKAISVNLKPLKMVLCSSRETVSLNLKNKILAEPPVYEIGSNEPILSPPEFEWPDNTFTGTLTNAWYLHT